MTRHLAFAALMTVPLMNSAAVAQQGSTPPCTGAENRTLDFWVGDWIAEWDQNGQKGSGTNRITRDEYGSCVITEHFRDNDGSMIGHSVSTYRPGLKQWRQTWVDNQGGYFDLVGNPMSGGTDAFYFENKRVSEKQPHQRMVFQDVKPNSFTWRWQHRAKPEDAWIDDWVIRYRRKGPPSS